MSAPRWIRLDSSMIVSYCGESGAANGVDELLDATGIWIHTVDEAHEFVLDLGESFDVNKVRFKNTAAYSPTNIDVYVSTDGSTWGTAVLTSADATSGSGTDWVEYATTEKTGQYIKFSNMTTARADNYIAWGSASKESIDVFQGTPGDRFTTYINLTDGSAGTSSGTYVPTDGSLCLIQWDGTKYTNIIEAYLECVVSHTGSGTPNALPAAGVQVYDRTNSAEVGAVAKSGTTADLIRSDDIMASLPAGVATLDVRVRAQSGATTATCWSARLVIVQEVYGSTDTRIYIPVGANVTGIAAAYAIMSGIGISLSPSDGKNYVWDEDDFATIDNVEFQANFSAVTIGTTYCKLDNDAAGTGLVEFSTTALVPTLQVSGDISGTIVDGTTYTTYGYNGGRRASAAFYGAWIVVDLTNVSKFQSLLSINSYGENLASATPTTYTGHRAYFNKGTDYYNGPTVVTTHTATYWQLNDTNCEASIVDDASRDTNTDLLTTNSTPTVGESSAFTSIADGSNMQLLMDLGASGFSQSAIVGGSGVLYTVTDIESGASTGTNMQINISDTFKDVEELSINIGDVWKPVVSVQINVGDSWRTVF